MCLRLPGLHLLFIFKKFLFFLHFQKTETQLFLYQHLCPCVLSSVLFSQVLLLRYVFSLFRVEKLFSSDAMVTGRTIKVKFKDILGVARPTCAPPIAYATESKTPVNATYYKSFESNPQKKIPTCGLLSNEL